VSALDWAEAYARSFEPRARRYPTPLDMAVAVDSKTGRSPALDEINDALVELMETDEHDALAVYMPPQEGKSQLCARRLPEWVLDYDQSIPIAVVSYEQDTALRWGRDIKNDVGQNPCPNHGECETACGGLHIPIRRDSHAAGRWDTPTGGGLYCVGVGGALTGRPVRLLIVDDPVKDRGAAESKVTREGTWNWWESVALTRLAPGSKVVLIQCMTGDTPVLMGDGTQKPLRDVRPGDIVATYEHSGVTTSTVRNWANQGPDTIYEIRMKSGTVVRANARHPFLTVRGDVETWQRTAQLSKGDRILRVTGASGAGSCAPAVSRRVPQDLPTRDCACPATTSSDGPPASAHLPSMRRHGGQRISSAATASRQKTMTAWLQSRAASALSVNVQIGSQRIGTRRSALITAMTRAGYAACSATTATMSFDMPRQRRPCGQQLTTCAIELDEVAEVVPCGVEDVYDIQVDRTENFIANGLVSHNTRWHEDDLAGRIESRPSPLRWRIIRIPAIADSPDDPLERPRGTEMISVRGRPPGYFRNLKATMSPYVFSGIYQQSPTAAEGNFFRRAAYRYWRWMEPTPDGRERVWCEGTPHVLGDMWRFITMDFAASTKDSADYTVASCWAITLSGDLLLLDRVRERVPDHEHFTMAQKLRALWHADMVYVESNWWSKTFVKDARHAGVPVALVQADTDKVTRAVPAAGRVHAGRVYFPAEVTWLDEWCDELASFPSGSNDDQVDTLSYAVRVQIQEWTPAQEETPRPGRSPHDQVTSDAFSSATGQGDFNPMDLPYLREVQPRELPEHLACRIVVCLSRLDLIREHAQPAAAPAAGAAVRFPRTLALVPRNTLEPRRASGSLGAVHHLL
jgi:predicted phage terminase large subunit-like protein